MTKTNKRTNRTKCELLTHVCLKKVIAIFAVLAVFISTTANATPGTPTDPLVSRSYVDTRIAELEETITALTRIIADMQVSGADFPTHVPVPPDTNWGQGTNRELFEVIRVESGSTLIGGASTEIILRAGQATVVAGENGLVNVTSGQDIANGQTVPLNNLLIVPVADGRGLRFSTAAYIMVKGDFTIA